MSFVRNAKSVVSMEKKRDIQFNCTGRVDSSRSGRSIQYVLASCCFWGSWPKVQSKKFSCGLWWNFLPFRPLKWLMLLFVQFSYMGRICIVSLHYMLNCHRTIILVNLRLFKVFPSKMRCCPYLQTRSTKAKAQRGIHKWLQKSKTTSWTWDQNHQHRGHETPALDQEALKSGEDKQG